jgi:hypothetical protein
LEYAKKKKKIVEEFRHAAHPDSSTGSTGSRFDVQCSAIVSSDNIERAPKRRTRLQTRKESFRIRDEFENQRDIKFK